MDSDKHELTQAEFDKGMADAVELAEAGRVEECLDVLVSIEVAQAYVDAEGKKRYHMSEGVKAAFIEHGWIPEEDT